MAFLRPTLTELADRITQDLVTRMEIGSAVLRRAIVRVHALAMAGAAHMMHGHLEHLSKQIFPDLSEDDYLVRQAALFGLSIRAAEFAVGTVEFTGVNGTVIPEDTVLLRDDGAEYKTDAEVTIAAGVADAAVTAVLAGAGGNADAATVLTLESPIAGVDSEATVDGDGLSAGSDEETVAQLRTRLLERLRNPPHGGTAADYVAWAKEVPGVTRAWCYPMELGLGTVTVRFTRDDDVSIIPSAPEIEAVQEHIDELRPVTADVTVVAPIAAPLDFTLHIEPDNSATRAAVEAELEDLILRTSEPAGTTLLSQIEVAVGVAEGIEDFTIWSPTTDTIRPTGQLTTMGTITWT